MDQSIARLLDCYDRGAIGRRQLICALGALLGTAADGDAADFEPKNIDHVSVTVTSPERSADFYRETFGLGVVGQPGPDGAIRLGIDGRLRLTLRPGPSPGVIDHFSFGVEPFDQGALAQILARRGVKSYTEP